jgi:hypothetical protein
MLDFFIKVVKTFYCNHIRVFFAFIKVVHFHDIFILEVLTGVSSLEFLPSLTRWLGLFL